MYNRILNRPMFKLGGNTIDAQGTGITSGLDVPRQGYAHEPGHVQPLDASQQLKKDLSRLNVGVPESTRKRAFWSGIGGGFGDPSVKTLGEALWKSTAARDVVLDPAEAAAAKRKAEVETLGVTAPFEADVQKELKTIGTDVQWKIAQLDAKTQKEVAKMQADNKVKAIELRENKALFDAGHISEKEFIDRKKEIIYDINLQKDMNALAIKLVASGMSTKETAAEDAFSIITSIGISIEELRKTQATGGRIGYQFGTGMQGAQSPQIGSNQPTQVSLNVDETIQTPTGTVQEDVSIRENIQPSVNMTYQEFRAKMPPQVDDEIVQLIYYNQDAFADFAQIKTQDEVYAFNNKWGVSLVLPFDTETT